MENDITYQRFGRLTAAYRVDDAYYKDGTHHHRWLCFCDCGNCCIVLEGNLKSGVTKSCGCYRREVASENQKKHLTKHNETHTRLYHVWCNMRRRCNNPTDDAYPHYGGRGIKVCDEWQTFIPFRDWSMEHGYDPNAKHGECTIDRRDVNGDYCPDNCRWVNMLVQQNNKTNNRKYTWNGETKTIKQWAEELGIDRTTLTYRIDKSGMTFEEAITIPVVRKDRLINYNKETHTINQWSKITGLSTSAIVYRIDRLGWSIEKALTEPADCHQKKITFNGETLSRQEWARRYNMSFSTLRGRLNRGWSVEEALTTPVRAHCKKAG